MIITNKELLEFAKTQNPKAKLHLDCSINWLAAQTATQLSGKEHRMNGWKKFEDFFELPYKGVTPEYAEWSEGINKHNIENNTYITFQDAVEALESFN